MTVSRIGQALLFVLMVVYAAVHFPLFVLISPWALGMVVLGAFVLAYIEGSDQKSRIQGLGKHSILIALLGLPICIMDLMGFWNDPTFIGPALAFGLLGLLYGSLLNGFASIRHNHHYGDSLPSHSALMGVYATGVFLSLMASDVALFGYISAIDIDTRVHNLETTTAANDKFLRRLAPAVAPVDNGTILQRLDAPPSSESARLSVSSDRLSWVFVDQKLVGRVPIYQVALEPGPHQIKLTACPSFVDMQKDDVTWSRYWENATDGTCDYPTHEEMVAAMEGENPELDSEGRYRYEYSEDAVVVETYVMAPGVNHCCDADLVKEFTATGDGNDLNYYWSFDRNEWLLEPPSADSGPQGIQQGSKEDADGE
jgi:hypothetical protein